MNIVFFANPDFFADQFVGAFTSMPRFTRMLADGMKERGHKVEILAPKARLFKLPVKKSMKKYLGYVDQYILFAFLIRRRLKKYDKDTLFVFTDQAQGPWVRHVVKYRHVIHCHDFLSQLSALGEIPGNPLSFTGKLYQYFIRKGLRNASHFVCVSKKTLEDLNRLFPDTKKSTTVVYNGLANLYKPYNIQLARQRLGKKTGIDLTNGYLLHVGGNLWYKNRTGVVEMYIHWRTVSNLQLPLLIIGEKSTMELLEKIENTQYKNHIHTITGFDDEFVRLAYAGAIAFLFPSIAEGFGWPIAEAMACGCPVITTNKAPMTEVGGLSAFYLPEYPNSEYGINLWAKNAAITIENVCTLPASERTKIIEMGLLNANRFNLTNTLDMVEQIYSQIRAITQQ